MILLAAIPSWVIGLLVALFFLICIILILTVLIQRPQGGGLSGAFGSAAGSGQTAFGAKTGDALTIATIAMFVIYLLVAVGLNYAVRPPAPPPDRFAYLPFGVGARICIGAHFALVEATLALAKIIAAFRVELLDKVPVTPIGVVTTQPDRSPMFRIARR